MAEWIDLLDPDADDVRRRAPSALDSAVLDVLVAPAHAEGRTRPRFQGYGDFVFGVVLAAALDAKGNRLVFQEVDLVITRDSVLTVRKTPPDAQPFDPTPVQEVCARRQHVPAGMIVYYLLDEVAEGYLDVVDGVDGEIDELESHLADWPADRIRARMTSLRRDLLSIRRTLAPTRDAVRGVVDGRVDIDPGVLRREVFPDEIERALGNVHANLLRATESLDFARDLLAGVRDYHATEIAMEQSDVVKRLTAVASLLLFPTFIVGVYGQNFEHMPELDWYLGYAFSWGLIVLVTIVQLVVFRLRGWL